MTVVALEHLTIRFANGVTAVNDVSLEVEEGELIVLVGPSGSGKTTLLRLIAGLEQPTSGTIQLRGQVANDWPPRQRDVAMVFQRPALYPYLNVRDNLAFGLWLRQPGWFRRMWKGLFGRADIPVCPGSVQADRNVCPTVIQSLGLTDLLDRRPSQLSGGEQQRVALGRALVRRAGLLLLDEPLSNFDPAQRHELRRELHLLQRRFRATMIYVTHDQAEAMTLGDRVVVLERGTVRQVGRPQTLYDRPADRFVAGFLGWPPMNFVEGTLAGDGPRLRFTGGGLALLVPRACRLDSPGKVMLGVRPEDVRLAAAGEGGSPRLTLTARLVEPLGPSCLVTLERDSLRLLALADSRQTVTEGDELEVTLNMDRLYWFDGATGLALAPMASG